MKFIAILVNLAFIALMMAFAVDCIQSGLISGIILGIGLIGCLVVPCIIYEIRERRIEKHGYTEEEKCEMVRKFLKEERERNLRRYR